MTGFLEKKEEKESSVHLRVRERQHRPTSTERKPEIAFLSCGSTISHADEEMAKSALAGGYTQYPYSEQMRHAFPRTPGFTGLNWPMA